ncbi:MAG: hypothetical protein ACOCWQ_01315 [Nanoarchaeota archaeon]
MVDPIEALEQMSRGIDVGGGNSQGDVATPVDVGEMASAQVLPSAPEKRGYTSQDIRQYLADQGWMLSGKVYVPQHMGNPVGIHVYKNGKFGALWGYDLSALGAARSLMMKAQEDALSNAIRSAEDVRLASPLIIASASKSMCAVLVPGRPGEGLDGILRGPEQVYGASVRAAVAAAGKERVEGRYLMRPEVVSPVVLSYLGARK